MEASQDILAAVVVTASARENTESAVLNMQRNSGVVMDGLSAQSIRRAGASTIASAVRSVPGVSVQGGKYVYVRGLGDRYSKSKIGRASCRERVVSKGRSRGVR